MSYEVVKPEYYQFRRPDTPWHAGSRGWTKSPWVTWGDNPNLMSTPRLAVNGCVGCGLGREGDTTRKVILGGMFVLVGAIAYMSFFNRPLYHKVFGKNPRRRRRRRSGYRSNRGSGCRGRGAYLLPKEGKYPAPTKECLKTALAYASWPNNLPDAGRVIRAARKHTYGSDPDIQAQIRKLAKKYKRETGKRV